MRGLSLVAVGAIPPGLLTRLTSFLSEAIDVPCRTSGSFIDPAPAYDRTRGQYDTRLLLPPLERLAHEEGSRVMGVADVDLFSAVFTFVFGETKLGGDAGVFSIHRLRPTFYGLEDDPALIMDRALKESLHETGHLLGMVHCHDASCVMKFSSAAEEVDLKRSSFCPTCQRILKRLTPR